MTWVLPRGVPGSDPYPSSTRQVGSPVSEKKSDLSRATRLPRLETHPRGYKSLLVCSRGDTVSGLGSLI
jgi:hypothetical protein